MSETPNDSASSDASHNPLSGRSITENLVAGNSGTEVKVDATPDSEKEKEALNERLRAERFGIDGAITKRFAESVVIIDPQTERPTLAEPITARPIWQQAYQATYYISGEDVDADDGFPQPGKYKVWEPNAENGLTRFEDFQKDAEEILKSDLEKWGTEQEAQDTEVWGWAERLVEVGRLQSDLDVVEGVFGPDSDGDPEFKGGEDAPKTAQEVFGSANTLPVDNIPRLYGNLAIATLKTLDAQGILDENERLKVLDDIVLQTRDTSQHHIAHFTNGELSDLDDVKKILASNPTLTQDKDGRYRLDWDDRVKPRPAQNMKSRTQHCPAAYRVEDDPSAIELLGWAFNTELRDRGLLKPGAVDELVVFQRPAPKYIGPLQGN